MSRSATDLEAVPISPNLRSDHRFLFMFVRRTDGIYLLFKIDVSSLLHKNISEEELSPIIVFKHRVLPNCECSFEFIEPNFYIIGEKKDQNFTLDKYKLLELDPSESRRGGEFLKPIAPMYGEKLDPLSFIYNDRLYVISKGYYSLLDQIGKTYYDFEVYSPSHNTWNQLGNKPIREIFIKSHLILKHMVYFTTSCEVVLSYDLEDETWVTIFDPDGVLVRCPGIHIQPRPTFDTQVQVVGNMVFGGFYRKNEMYFDICASFAIDPNDDLFLRPTITQDLDFYKQIYSRSHELYDRLSERSKYIVTIDENHGIICLVCYGNKSWDKLSNYVVLNFFKVTGNSYKCDIPLVEVEEGNEHLPIPFCWHSIFNYAHDEVAEHENAEHVNFFESKFISSTFLPINTKSEVTLGILYGCMFV